MLKILEMSALRWSPCMVAEPGPNFCTFLHRQKRGDFLWGKFGVTGAMLSHTSEVTLSLREVCKGWVVGILGVAVVHPELP